MHFVPAEIQEDRKATVIMLFATHIAFMFATLINFVASCIEGGLGILYSILIFFLCNPIILFVFYRGST